MVYGYYKLESGFCLNITVMIVINKYSQIIVSNGNSFEVITRKAASS